MFKRLSLYTLLLCFVPFFAWITGYHWAGNTQLSELDHALFYLTESGSVPYALISCVIFALLFRFLFHSRRQWLIAVAIMGASVLATQALKSGLKTLFAEPRPFAVYLAEQTHFSTQDFYALPRAERAIKVAEFFQTDPNTPAWLTAHYEKETGFSFPSGHSIFAATWLMLAVGFTQLMQNRRLSAKLLLGAITHWSLLMLISRLRLGMHYPIDLFAAIIAALLVNAAIFAILQKPSFFHLFHAKGAANFPGLSKKCR